MKKTSVYSSILIATSMFCAVGGLAQAQMISGIADLSPISSTASAPGDTTDYDYLSSNGGSSYTAPSVLTNFDVTQLGSGSEPSYTDSSYVNATDPAGGPSFQTIKDQLHGGAGDFLTFQLTNAAETTFNVYVLVNNAETDSTLDNDQTFTLTSSGSGSTVGNVIAGSNTHTDEYLEFSIAGATTSDVFTLSGTAQDQYIGGITFQNETVTVPEPATWSLLLGGVGALVILGKLRRRSV